MSLKRYRSGTEIPGDLGNCVSQKAVVWDQNPRRLSHRRYWSGTEIPGDSDVPVSQEVLTGTEVPPMVGRDGGGILHLSPSERHCSIALGSDVCVCCLLYTSPSPRDGV